MKQYHIKIVYLQKNNENYSEMNTNERGNFGSKLGIILASAGSAVGLGNIWRFPCETGENGGGAFLLIYIVCVIVLGMPIMISEFLIGRHSRANTATAYKVLAPGTHWRWVGRMGVFGAFLILSYYAVVAGWTLDYMIQALLNRFNTMARNEGSVAFTNYFNSFVADPFWPLFYLILFLLSTHYVIVRGVEKGIEKSSKIMMPFLFLILIMLAVCSLMMPGAAEGLKFIFYPDFSKVNSQVVISAMGQAFFSLSLGMGCLCTYASYFKSDANLTKTAFSVGLIDTFVAIMAGITIFPAVFSVQSLEPDAGPSLVFIALPNIFQAAFGDLPVLAYIFSILFYTLLVLASLTSTISLHEVVTAYISEAYKMTRKKAASIVTGGCIFLGIFCSLSMGVLKEYTVFGMNFFDLFDYVTAKLMLPLGGMLISVFTGWYLSYRVIWSELTNRGTIRFKMFNLFIFILRYIAPIGIGLVFLNELGILGFF